MYIVVEEGDAVVVEVEGDSRLRILLDLLPGPSRRGIVVNALGHDHARWRHLRQRETRQCFVGHEDEIALLTLQLRRGHRSLKIGLFDRTVADDRYRARMDIVGQAKQHTAARDRIAPQPAYPPRMQTRETDVGIVRGALQDYTAQESVGERRMNTVAAALAEARKPYPRTTYQAHYIDINLKIVRKNIKKADMFQINLLHIFTQNQKLLILIRRSGLRATVSLLFELKYKSKPVPAIHFNSIT